MRDSPVMAEGNGVIQSIPPVVLRNDKSEPADCEQHMGSYVV